MFRNDSDITIQIIPDGSEEFLRLVQKDPGLWPKYKNYLETQSWNPFVHLKRWLKSIESKPQEKPKETLTTGNSTPQMLRQLSESSQPLSEDTPPIESPEDILSDVLASQSLGSFGQESVLLINQSEMDSELVTIPSTADPILVNEASELEDEFFCINPIKILYGFGCIALLIAMGTFIKSVKHKNDDQDFIMGIIISAYAFAFLAGGKLASWISSEDNNPQVTKQSKGTCLTNLFYFNESKKVEITVNEHSLLIPK